MADKNRDWWRAHLQRIEVETLTTKAYAEREGLQVAALYHWRKVFKSEAARGQTGGLAASAQFMKLQLCEALPRAASPEPVAGWRLRLPAGLCLEMPGLPDAGWLAQLARDLQPGTR